MQPALSQVQLKLEQRLPYRLVLQMQDLYHLTGPDWEPQKLRSFQFIQQSHLDQVLQECSSVLWKSKNPSDSV